MAETYVTIEEAAELEEIKFKTISKRLERNITNYDIVRETVENGSKKRMLIALSSLSPKAKAAYAERVKLKKLAEKGSSDKAESKKEEKPWYVDTDVDWFTEVYKKEYYKAMELGNIIREFLDYDEAGRTEFADTFAAERLGKDKRTLYRYTKAYLTASAWADRLHKEDGGNYECFKVLCLCRKPKNAGTFPSFTPEVKQAIKNIWFNEDFARNQGTREMLYDKLTALKNINNWEKLPSYQSVTRYISFLMEDENMRNAWYLASRGEREYRGNVMVKAERNTNDLKVMQVLMGDEHTFDCWVSYKHPNGKITAVKPKLVAWVDIRSRMILGDVMCRDANSETLKESLLKLLYHDAGSVPQYIYIDNGKDYTSKRMTGFARNDRQRAHFDDATEGFYKSIGIEDYHRALPYYAWTKGQVERFFGTVCKKFVRWFKSYTGTLTGSKTSDKISKDINGMLERGELLTIEEFYEKWQNWVKEVYAVSVQGGLKAQGEKYTTPLGCFENAERYMKAVPPKSYATLLMMKSERRLVRNVGVKVGSLTYRSDDLCQYIGQHVDIKYDIHDMQTVYIFKNGKQVCEAYAQELMTFVSPDGVEQDALKEHLGRQKRQLKRDRELLREANIPFEELNAGYVGFSSTVGGIDLMIGKKPEKKEIKNNVISLPKDTTYKNGFRKQEDSNGNDYINRKAAEALRDLKAL